MNIYLIFISLNGWQKIGVFIGACLLLFALEFLVSFLRGLTFKRRSK